MGVAFGQTLRGHYGSGLCAEGTCAFPRCLHVRFDVLKGVFLADTWREGNLNCEGGKVGLWSRDLCVLGIFGAFPRVWSIRLELGHWQ